MITKFALFLFLSFNLFADGDVTQDICDYLNYNDYVYREYPYQNSKSEKEIKEMRELHTELKKNMVCGNLKRRVKFDFYSDVYLNNPVATIYYNNKATENEKKLMNTLLEMRKKTIAIKNSYFFLGGKLRSIVGLLQSIIYRSDDVMKNDFPILFKTCGDLIFGDKIYSDLTLKTSLFKLNGTLLAFQIGDGYKFFPNKKMMIRNMDYVLSGSINLGPWDEDGYREYGHRDFAGLDRIINCVQNRVIFGDRLPESKKIF